MSRFAFFARWAARLSSMLQIISHSVFNAAVSFGNCPRLRVAFRSLSVERLDRVCGVEHPPGRWRELQKRHEPLPSVAPNFDRLRVFPAQFTGVATG